DYSGPVLFTGQASAEMSAGVLAPNLSGQRLPLTDQQQAQTNRSELVDRLNRPVLPRFLSVFDDPTAQRIGNQELLGHYQVDDQGVPARRVSLIEQGVLKNFLMSRRPGKDMLQSNGHGRSVVPGRETAQIGNLFIQSKEGKSYEDLKQELIKMRWAVGSSNTDRKRGSTGRFKRSTSSLRLVWACCRSVKGRRWPERFGVSTRAYI